MVMNTLVVCLLDVVGVVVLVVADQLERVQLAVNKNLDEKIRLQFVVDLIAGTYFDSINTLLRIFFVSTSNVSIFVKHFFGSDILFCSVKKWSF